MEFKFAIGNSTDGEIGAVFYVRADNEADARAKLKAYVGTFGEPIRDRDENIECLVYFGSNELIAATKDVEEVENA